MNAALKLLRERHQYVEGHLDWTHNQIESQKELLSELYHQAADQSNQLDDLDVAIAIVERDERERTLF